MNKKKSSIKTVSKGYRLKQETHDIIKKMKKLLKINHNGIISEALEDYCLKKNIKPKIMKKLLILLSFSLQLMQFSYSQPTWFWQNPLPTGYNLNSVYFINSSTGFTGGNNGTLLKTTNGGLNWVALNAGSTQNINSIFFTDPNTGFVGAGNFQGLVFKTTNAGLNWTQQDLGLPYGVRSVKFINSNTGVAAFQSTAILLTTNAGNNWQQLTTNISYNTCVWAVSGTTFYSAGSSSVAKTTNAGLNWTTQNFGSGDILSICFTDSLNGILCGRLGLIKRTSNGGISWDLISSGIGLDIYSILYINSSTIVASSQGGVFLKSTNGGLNWSVAYLPATGYNNLFSIAAINVNEIFLSGAFGTICKSTNGGTNWTQLYETVNNSIYYSHFIDDNNGYAATTNSIIKTTNGGLNWVKLSSVSVGGPLHFRNSNTGYLAAMYAGTIYKTTNGGANFTTILSGYPSNFSAFSFVNENTGYTVTSSGKTLKTTNAGSNWVQIDSTPNAYYNKVVFTDSFTGYISGMKSSPAAALIKKTTNGGITWTEQTINSTLGITSLYFLNNNTGFAGSNNSGQNFFKTTNGGANWIAGSSVSPYVNDISFVNENIGYVSSLFGRFYRTTNGGNNWLQLTTPVDYDIRCIYHNNNSGITYLLGEGGMILKSTNGSITGFEQTGNNLPEEYFLSQNYPNPFNPKTRIKFKLLNGGFVNLAVYDITGKLIALLFNVNLNAGEHETEFDAGSLPSGVYFYRLKADNFIETRKMIILK